MYKEKLIVKLSEGLEDSLLEKFQESAAMVEESDNKSLLEALIELKESIIDEAKKPVKEEGDEEEGMDDEEEDEDDEEEGMDDEEEDEDDEEEVKEGKKKPMKEAACATKKSVKESVLERLKSKDISIEEDVNALFSGEELSEEFKEKATSIFEAAISKQIKEYKDQVNEAIDQVVSEEVESVSEELISTIDTYLDYVVEEWMEQNKISLEHGIRTEITEDFINGLKNLFIENYIEVPEGKEDVLVSIEAEKATIEEEYEAAIEKNIDLMAQIKELKKGIVISEMTKGLTDTEVEKLQSLVEDVKFTDEESFAKKVTHLKESYFNNNTTIISDNVIDTDEVIVEEVVTDRSMKSYIDNISKFIK